MKNPVKHMLFMFSLLTLVEHNWAHAQGLLCASVLEATTHNGELKTQAPAVLKGSNRNEMVIVGNIYRNGQGEITFVEVRFNDGSTDYRSPDELIPQVDQLQNLKTNDDVVFHGKFNARGFSNISTLTGGVVKYLFADGSAIVADTIGHKYLKRSEDLVKRVEPSSSLSGFEDGLPVTRIRKLRSKNRGQFKDVFEGWIVGLYSDGTAVVSDENKNVIIENITNLHIRQNAPTNPSLSELDLHQTIRVGPVGRPTQM
jgi:hypothetical protein